MLFFGGRCLPKRDGRWVWHPLAAVGSWVSGCCSGSVRRWSPRNSRPRRGNARSRASPARRPTSTTTGPTRSQATQANLAAGEASFLGDSRKISCASCHGAKGDGKGKLADQFDPPPRNFACKQTIEGVPDGQLFWIIRFGSPGTSMPPHAKFTDEQIWQIVLHLRRLAR